MANRLALETSPYLQQHAHNPVDWYPWGEEALGRARALHRPIFLSIGYAACHWCHVMERESFEDPATAELLNREFVSIKVDREERPDLDSIYMQAVVAMTGRGGWPMSVWLTSEGVPFYGGTYFPDVPRYGTPSFRQVLETLSATWKDQPNSVQRTAEQLRAVLQGASFRPDDPGALPTSAFLDNAVAALAEDFDWDNGGWGTAPKFPQPLLLDFLLHYQARTKSETAGQIVELALKAMAGGGVYDQLGGGFHRYSTDEAWLVPHFEKMLYDNALLARTYLHAWQLQRDPLFRRVVTETLDYVLREMNHPGGGFFSTQDADSEGQEGKYFLWTSGEIRSTLAERFDPSLDAGHGAGLDAGHGAGHGAGLGPGLSALFLKIYGVTERGNFEGRTILHREVDPREEAAETGRDPAEVEGELERARSLLLQARETRVKPARDEKVLTAWNGLMLAAFAEAGSALGRPDYLEAARRNAAFALSSLTTAEGRLFRSWRDGVAKLRGYLEDYAHLAEGLLALYRATFEARWFEAARDLAEQMLLHFAAPDQGFFDTADDHEALVIRPRDFQDNAVPSGNAMATTVLLRLAGLTQDPRYTDAAEAGLAAMQQMMRSYPTAHGQWLVALELALGPRTEIAVVGNAALPSTGSLLAAARKGFHPHQTLAWRDPGEKSRVPLLDGREPLAGEPTAWVCRRSSCSAPITDPEVLAATMAQP